MTLAYDNSASKSGANAGGSAATISPLSFNAASGANIWVAIEVDYLGAPSNVKYNGTALTLVDYESSANAGAQGGTYWYVGYGLGTGSAANVVFDCPATTWFSLVAYSQTGNVGGVTVVKNYGTGTALSSGAITVGAGHMALSAVGAGTSTGTPTLNAWSGGNTRQHLQDSNKSTALVVSDSTSNATFTATLSGSQAWSAVTLILTEVQYISPSGIASGEAFGGDAVGFDDAIIPATIASAEAFGTPDISMSILLSDSGIASAEAFGIPNTIMAPLDISRARLAAGLDDEWMIYGDSTCFGVYDDGSTSGYVFTTGTMMGAYGRFAYAYCQKLNVTLKVRIWDYVNYTTSPGYKPDVTLYDAGPGRPTLRVWLGGWPGASMGTYGIAFTAMSVATSPSVVIVHDMFNETSVTQFPIDIGVVNGLITAKYPSVPLVYTTENYTTATSESGHPSFSSLLTAMLGVFFTGATLPFSPALRASTKVSLAWVLDTRQATLTAADLYSDGLHPVANGYAIVAAALFAGLAPDLYADALQSIQPPSGWPGEFGTAIVAGPITAVGIPPGGVGTPILILPYGDRMPMTLKGTPPPGRPVLSYLGKPEGGIVGSVQPTSGTVRVPQEQRSTISVKG